MISAAALTFVAGVLILSAACFARSRHHHWRANTIASKGLSAWILCNRLARFHRGASIALLSLGAALSFVGLATGALAP